MGLVLGVGDPIWPVSWVEGGVPVPQEDMLSAASEFPSAIVHVVFDLFIEYGAVFGVFLAAASGCIDSGDGEGG